MGVWLKFLITNQLHIFKTSTSTHKEKEQYHEKPACVTSSDCTILVTFLKDFIHHHGFTQKKQILSPIFLISFLFLFEKFNQMNGAAHRISHSFKRLGHSRNLPITRRLKQIRLLMWKLFTCKTKTWTVSFWYFLKTLLSLVK